MIVERISPRTKKRNKMNLPITQEEIREWESGRAAQLVWPHLKPIEREFIMTGYTQEDWDWMFPPEPSDIDDDEDMGREGP